MGSRDVEARLMELGRDLAERPGWQGTYLSGCDDMGKRLLPLVEAAVELDRWVKAADHPDSKAHAPLYGAEIRVRLDALHREVDRLLPAAQGAAAGPGECGEPGCEPRSSGSQGGRCADERPEQPDSWCGVCHGDGEEVMSLPGGREMRRTCPACQPKGDGAAKTCPAGCAGGWESFNEWEGSGVVWKKRRCTDPRCPWKGE